jgi:hypothetical protein
MMKRVHIGLQAIVAVMMAVTLPATARAQDGTGVSPRPHAPAAVTETGPCIIGHVSFHNENTCCIFTSSQSFVDIPNNSVNFQIPGVVPACAIVTFSAHSFASGPGEILAVQALLDGVPMAPGAVQFSGDDDEDNDGRSTRTHSVTFVATSVPAGVHTVQMQFQSENGFPVFLTQPSVVVTSK